MAPRRDLTPADACWLYSEWEKNHQTVSAFLWTEGRVDRDEFRDLVRRRLVERYPVFAQRVVMSRNPLMMPHWEDDPEFDLDRHIVEVDLPDPGDRAALENLVSEQRSPLLDRDHPLWTIYLIQGFDGDNSAVHARIQHSIADGWSLVRLFLSLTDEEEDAEADAGDDDAADGIESDEGHDEASSPSRSERGRESPLRLRRRGARVVRRLRGVAHPATVAAGREALEETLSVAADPSRFVEFGTDVSESLARRVQEAGVRAMEAGRFARYGIRDGVDFTFPPRPGKTILHGDVSGTKRVAWMDPRPLAPVKAAGRTHGATINDVLLGAQTNALRQYLLDRDALDVDELFTAVPVSLRALDEPLPETLGNRFGLVPVLLPIGEPDPIAQVLEIKRQVDEIKQSTMPIMSFGLMGFSALTTPDVERLIHKLNQAHSIGVTTNVPGPRHDVWLCGSRVVGMWGMGGVSGDMNLSFGIFTLNGEINYAVHSDAAITPDPEEIVRLFAASVDTLVRLSGG